MPAAHASSTSTARPDRARGGWIVWAIFVVGVCIATLLKPSLFVLRTGERVSAKVTGETPTEWTVASKDVSTGGNARTIKKADVQAWYRYGEKSVTPEYHRAAQEWWKSKAMYTEGVHGFLYLPQAAMLYSPFACLPAPIEETLWRIAGIALLAWGVRRLCARLWGEGWGWGEWGSAFLIASGLIVVSALGSATNGQTNIHLAGLFALCCADLIDKRWWRVGLWLALALACKPTAVVMILLVGAVYLRPMGWRLAVVLGVFAAAPFVHPSPAYVGEQYRECFTKMAAASQPGDAFQDIRGMLMEIGVVRVERVAGAAGHAESVVQSPPESVLTAVRAAAALATLGLCVLASRRLGGIAAAMTLYALGAVYLTLFNPRTEGLSYILLGTPAALWAAREVLHRRWVSATFCIFFVLSTQLSTQIAMNHKNYWVRPLGAAVFAGLVAAEVLRGRSRWDADRGATGR